MPYEPAQIVDFCVAKEFDSLENAFADLANLRIDALITREREALGKQFSPDEHEDAA